MNVSIVFDTCVLNDGPLMFLKEKPMAFKIKENVIHSHLFRAQAEQIKSFKVLLFGIHKGLHSFSPLV